MPILSVFFVKVGHFRNAFIIQAAIFTHTDTQILLVYRTLPPAHRLRIPPARFIELLVETHSMVENTKVNSIWEKISSRMYVLNVERKDS